MIFANKILTFLIGQQIQKTKQHIRSVQNNSSQIHQLVNVKNLYKKQKPSISDKQNKNHKKITLYRSLLIFIIIYLYMSQKLVLYWNIASQPARAVKALLQIGKIPHEQVVLDLPKLIGRKPQSKFFLEINHLGQIPAIKDGNFVLAQSGAIMSYICDKYTSSILNSYYPKDIKQRAKVDQYTCWYQSNFRPAFMQIIKLKIYGKVHKDQYFTEQQIKRAQEKMEDALKMFDSILSLNGDFVCGKSPSIADILLYFQLTNYQLYDKTWDNHKNVNAWFKRMYAIPEIKSITHTWFSTVPQFKKILSTIKPTKVQPKL